MSIEKYNKNKYIFQKKLKNTEINLIYIYKRLHPRKKIRNRKKERATETLNLNTKPLKFKCGLADGGGGGGLVDDARHGYPHLV